MVTGGTVGWTAEVVLGLVLVVILVVVLAVVVVAAGAMVSVAALMVVVVLTGLGVVETVVVVLVVIAVVGGLVGVASGAPLVIGLVDVASAVGDATGGLSPIVPPAVEAADGTGVNVEADEAVLVVINGSIANMAVDVWRSVGGM